MNRELFFWNRWLPVYRWMFVSLLVLLGAALTIYLIQYFVGADAVIGWNVTDQLQDVNLTLYNFTRGIFNFTVQAPSFLVVEWFEASDMRTNHAATYVYGALTACGVAGLLAVVPSLPRWWYLGSMMVFIGLVVGFQTDVLQVAGLTNWVVPGVTLAVFLPFSYGFHAFRPDISVVVRLGVFALLVAGMVAFWAFFAKSPLPVMSVLSYGTRVLALLTVLFIVLVSVEVPAALLSLITSTGVAAGRNSIFHFTVVTLFYVANLVVAYLNNSGLIEWDFLYVNAFYLLVVSVVLGIWGFRRRIDDVLSDPYGAMLYIGWAVLALGTVGYSFATGNDPMTDLYEDTIVYSHLAMGVAFFLYVYVNFRGPMAQGLPVHKIVFQPRIMPFGLALALTGLIMLILLLRVGMFPFNQGVAGYHNYLGDLYFAQGQDVLAETYYKKALLFQQSNHKSNYALASIARRHDNPEAMAAFLKQAIDNKPTPHTYAALSQLYSREDLFFDALFTLREGTRRFPDNGELLHNMAVLYERTRLPDSAYLFYQQALPHVKRPETVQTNLLALWAKIFSGPQLDSVLNATPSFDSHAFQNNRLTISNLLQKTDAQPYLPVGGAALTRAQFAYLYNYTLNQRSRPDSTAAHTINKLSENPNNAGYSGYLGFARAAWLYQNRQTGQAVELMRELEQGTDGIQSAHLNNTLGLWYLQQNAPSLATYRFGKALQAGDTLNLLNELFARTENGEFASVAPRWDSLRLSPLPQFRAAAGAMAKITRTLLGSRDSLSDAEKTAVVFYSRREDLTPLITSISDLSYRASALLFLAQNHLKNGNVLAAESDLRALQSLTLNDSTARKLIANLELDVLWRKRDWNGLGNALANTDSPRKTFYQAEIAAATGKTTEAEKRYAAALRELPFDQDVTLAASAFYARNKNPDRAHQILSESLQTYPTATEVRKAYVLQSLELNLTDYAAQGMEALRQQLPAADYQAFVPQYEAKRALVEKKMAAWE